MKPFVFPLVLPLLAGALVIAGCDSGEKSAASERVVRFVAFGDAGRGNENQHAVADAMVEICNRKGCDFALELGDNIYDSGVGSVDDEQFQTKFEKPYENLDIPVYVTLGNHDNSGLVGGDGSNNRKGEFQVQYTHAAQGSGKWKMPDRYYSFVAPLNASGSEAPLAEFFCLDSNPMAAYLPDLLNTRYNYISYANTQLQWFQSALTRSKARWKFTFSHHPYVSNGLHNNAGRAEGIPGVVTASAAPWKAFIDASVCDPRYGVDMMFYGHDHELQWLKPVASCNDTTEFVLSGGGSDVREFGDPERNAAHWQQDLMPGFFWFELRDDVLIGEAYVLENLALQRDGSGRPRPAYTRRVQK